MFYKNRKFVVVLFLLATMGLMVACAGTAKPSPTPVAAVAPTATTPADVGAKIEGKPFAGITINLFTQQEGGLAIYEPLKRRAPDFEALTGAKVNVIGKPFGEMYQEILTDLKSGTHKYDAYVYAPQWMPDFVPYLTDLTDMVAADEAIKWEDIAPFFRNSSATYGGRIYTIPLDGDFLMAYYRKDVLEKAGLKPPNTWQEYLEVAAAMHGKDFNGDGEPDYGSCIGKAHHYKAYAMFGSIAVSFLQSQGTAQGAFFDPETMKPLTNNEAFAKALDIYKETAKYGPPNELELSDNDVRVSLFASGRCALTIDWGDTGTRSAAPDSKVKDKVGTIILPGSAEVLNRATGKLMPCDKQSCPFAIGGINHAPYAAFGGWSGGVNRSSAPESQKAAYAFLSYVSQPAQSNVDVTIGKTGFNPYRISQFMNRQIWVEAGMSPASATDYLVAIQTSLSVPNMVLDLRLPENYRYQTALDEVLYQFSGNQVNRDEAMKRISDEWEKITTELGPDKQLKIYRETLGVSK